MDLLISISSFMATFELRLLKSQEDLGELDLINFDLKMIILDIDNRLTQIGISHQLTECAEEISILKQHKRELNRISLNISNIKANMHRVCQ